LAAVLELSLSLCITNVQAMQSPLIKHPKNQQIELGKIKANMEEKNVSEKNQLDLLSSIVNDGKNSWGPIMFLYLEGGELRKCNMVCKTFYNIIHAKTFMEFRAEIEFQKTLENYFQKFNPQTETIGPYEIKMTIQNNKNDFVLDKFQSTKFYFPFSLTFYKPNNNKHFQAIFIPSKNIQENYLPPFEKPERHIPFDSNLLVSTFPYRFRDEDGPADEKLFKLTYKIDFENMNQLVETYFQNKYHIKRRKIWLKQKLVLHWTIFIVLLSFDSFLWYTAVWNKNATIANVCAFLGTCFTGCLLILLLFLMHSTCLKPPNNGSDDF
jgi:hypothetical protein